jgi:glycosyltransferase involved in cell wall biosynthesis
MRRLLPTRLYPGSKRVGAPLTKLALAPSVSRFDGVDWYWLPSLFGALRFLLRQGPRVLILQYWTGTVLHTYLVLATVARLLGRSVVIEFHEALDPGEDSLAWASSYAGTVAPWLCRLASGYVVHSEYDRHVIDDRYSLGSKPIEVIPHGTYGHCSQGSRRRAAPPDCCNLLYFGLIRPYKGVEDLIRAFDAIPPIEIHHYWLTVVGETWEQCTQPARLIERSRYRDRITFINRYVSDEEVDGLFGGADAVILPYHRSSQSGTLHLALHYGLPVVVTAVGGLVETVAGYPGAILTEPANPSALLAAIRTVADLRGERFANPRSWATIVQQYTDFLSRLA